MLDIALLVLKVVALPVIALLLVITFLHFRVLTRISFYEKQGVVTYPGAKSFPLGNMLDMMAYGSAAAKSTQEKVEPLPNPSMWIANRFMDKIGVTGQEFDGVKYPVVFFNKLTMPQLIVSDPEMVQDLYVTKNSKTDKDGFAELMFKDLIGNSFIFSFNDKRWKEKRKACAHAFYKERLNQMLEVLKEKVIEHIEKHMTKIRDSSESFSIMDFEEEFSNILSRNIVHICFGVDLCHEKLTMRIQERKNGPWVWRDFHIPQAIGHLLDQMNTSYGNKYYNPFNWLAPYTLWWFDLSSYNRVYLDNARRVREFIENFVIKRKAGLIRSTVKQDSDLLSLFLSRPDVFSDVDVIDEIIDFFGAASETTQKSLQTFMAHFAKSPESRRKIREEFKKVIAERVAENPEMAKWSMADLMKELINFDNIKDLEYLNWVWQEALRYQAPGSASTDLIFREDTKVGKYHVKAYDRIQVNFHALHFDYKQWQKPHEFIPERFDNSNPISKTPDGKKRSAVCWTPFFGGMRICFGKTFAEANQKIIAIYFSMFFDTEFVDKEKYGPGKEYPLAHFLQSFHPAVLVKLTENKDKYLE